MMHPARFPVSPGPSSPDHLWLSLSPWLGFLF